ncbi:flagellar assembly protein FliX [Mariluticola halotolerans]|uniref:flagellar assembly protein FliX n=1 Tax=Mariluticola halotolerans TaxID=2909283 RepID=UPI0026E21CC3|nr:flagellar assembly protein FliX [Mariluticola halotolerans]UJQ95423.1 flagellar assembly protein FliX [Mariluticola halotolerans]
MRIDGPGRSGKVNQRGDARRAGGSGPAFTLGDGEAAARANASAPSGPVTGMDAILALQAVEDPLYARRKSAKRGESILDALEEMKADLLTGRINEGKLNRLMALLKQAKIHADPQLDALIEDIELRALVELAKLGRFPAI